MTTAKSVPSARSWRIRFSRLRRLTRPVRPSVEAWSCVSAITRSMPTRLPAWFASVCSSGDRVVVERLADRPVGVHDTDGATHDRDGHADARAAAGVAAAQHRARVEVFAVGEHLRLRASRGDAPVR